MKTATRRLFALVLAAALALLVLLTACAAPAPAPSGSSQPESAGTPVPEPSVSVPENVGTPVPEPSVSVSESASTPAPGSSAPLPDPAPAVELPQSIQIGQPTDNHESHWRWSLEVTDPGEMTELLELLSTDDLTPLTKGQDRWPDGGTPTFLQLHYADRTVQFCTYPEERCRIRQEENRATLGVGEEFYAFPADRCDRLLAFLAEKEAPITD